MEKTRNMRRERKDTVRNMERVLQAANELFAEHGTRVTMEEVAKRAGVGVGTVYRRFSSKEDLFAAVSHAACNATRHSLQCAVADTPDLVGKLRALVAIMFARFQFQAALLDPDARQRAALAAEQQALYGDISEMMLLLISEGQRQGVFAPGNAALRAALCTELLTPRSFQRLIQSFDGNSDTVGAYVVDFMLEGLRAR